MEYKKVYNIEEADFWLAFEDERREFLKDRVTPGKYYKVELLPDNFTNIKGEHIEDEDYFIRDDKGDLGMHYMVWRGEFVKKTI